MEEELGMMVNEVSTVTMEPGFGDHQELPWQKLEPGMVSGPHRRIKLPLLWCCELGLKRKGESGAGDWLAVEQRGSVGVMQQVGLDL